MTTETAGKSGIKALKPGDLLFNDGDNAVSLFIIQKGQIRLYKPKGKGFIELGVLRAGEVIGEMAYFDEDGSGRKRSASAAAITPAEVIEVSFVAFGKTMQSLNPWFKTIINTLVARLRKGNNRIKELEDNQSVAYGTKAGEYEFIKPLEVMKVLGTIFLIFKAHGEVKGQALAVNRRTLNLYASDTYQIMEVKTEFVVNLLVQLGWMDIKEDEDKMPNLLLLKNIEIIRQIFIFYNTEKHMQDNKKLKIFDKCEMLLAKMVEKGAGHVSDIPNLKIVDDIAPKFTKYFDLTEIMAELKAKNISVSADNVDDGKNVGFFGEAIMQNGKILVEADFPKIQKMYPVVRFMNAVKKSNAEKATAG
jgi:CRP/FNR family cyclic AMP-dependent transcriptional regulator